jgi:hypothetical protein
MMQQVHISPDALAGRGVWSLVAFQLGLVVDLVWTSITTPVALVASVAAYLLIRPALQPEI